MSIKDRNYGKDYSENIINPILGFNKSQTWTRTTGTGTADLNTNKAFQGVSSLRIENTTPTTDASFGNATHETTIGVGGVYNLSFYLLKEEPNEFIEFELNVFKNASPLFNETFTLGSEDADEDSDAVWVRFMASNNYTFTKSDAITFTLTIKAKSGTSLTSTTLFLDGIMLCKANRVSRISPPYVLPTETVPNYNTGWAQYGDSQYTSGSPLSCPSGVSTTIDLDGLSGTVKSQLPEGVLDLYDVATSKIIPVASGDGFSFAVGFKAQSSATNGYATVGVDIGGAFGEIFKRTFAFPRGANNENDFYFTSSGYQLDTFLQNGGVLKITSGTGTVTIWDITLQIHRTHVSK